MAVSDIIQSNNSGAVSNKKSYQGLLDANPYRNITYTKTPWQKFLGWLGFRTEADAWKENMDVQAREYDAAILQKQYDEEYNDPQSQMNRMRAAGINPDIDGGSSIDSGSAAPLGEDPSTPMQTTGASGTFVEFANGVLSAFSSSLGLLQSVQGIHRNRLNNVMQSISNEKAFSDFTKGVWPSFLPESPNPSADSGVSLMANPFDWQAAALNNAQQFAGKLPKKMRNKFISQVQQYWSSGPGQAESYKDWSDRVKNRREFFTENNTFYSDIDDVLMDTVQPLVDMSMKIFNKKQDTEYAELSASDAEAQKREEYALNVDGTQAAKTENAQNKASEGMADIQATLRSTMNQMTRNLQNTADKGGFKGTLAQLMLLMMCMQQMQMLPSMSAGAGGLKIGF